MASSQSRGAERMIHQDYIARIRYSNALPPPPNPPKLLDIPNTGLASGQYTNPGFASRLARDQPLNIEADAELGMPLDLVGMPGIFDGDESSIQAPLHPPVPHPHDRALLRPLSTLGKPKFSDAGVSFLRRTEYISSYQSKSRFDSASKNLAGKNGSRPQKVVNLDKESPEYIKSEIEKGFQEAASFIREPSRVKHPTKRNLKLVSAHPLLPDLDAFPDAGGYVSLKFLVNPVPPSTTYDIRLERSILRPMAPTKEEELANSQAQELYERDPEHNPAPVNNINFEFFLPQGNHAAENFKRRWSVYDEDRDDDALYPNKNDSGQPIFRLKRLRAYESVSATGSTAEKYDDEVMIAVHDGTDGLHQKAAYYYPILQKTTIRPQRNKNIHKHKTGYEEPGEDNIHFLDVEILEPTEAMKDFMAGYKDNPFHEDEMVTEEAGEQEVGKETTSSSPVGKDDEDEKSD